MNLYHRPIHNKHTNVASLYLSNSILSELRLSLYIKINQYIRMQFFWIIWKDWWSVLEPWITWYVGNIKRLNEMIKVLNVKQSNNQLLNADGLLSLYTCLMFNSLEIYCMSIRKRALDLHSNVIISRQKKKTRILVKVWGKVLQVLMPRTRSSRPTELDEHNLIYRIELRLWINYEHLV
jgi:hypothetical protein